MRLGVPILGTKKKSVVSAAAFLAALEGGGGIGGTAITATDPAVELRQRLGLRLVHKSTEGEGSHAARPAQGGGR